MNMCSTLPASAVLLSLPDHVSPHREKNFPCVAKNGLGTRLVQCMLTEFGMVSKQLPTMLDCLLPAERQRYFPPSCTLKFEIETCQG